MPFQQAALPTQRRFPRLQATVLLLLFLGMIGGLSFFPAPLGKTQVVAATGLGLAVLAACQATGLTRLRRRSLTLVVLLIPVSTMGGYVGWKYRRQLSRTQLSWDLIEPKAVTAGAELGERPDAARLRRAAFEHFRERSFRDVRSFPPLAPEEAVRRSDEVLASTFQFFANEPATLPQDLDWTEDPYEDRTWHWFLHTMDFVQPLTWRYAATGDLKYLACAERHVLDWIEDNHLFFFDPPSRASWNDHATARRVRAWLPFWEVWRRSPLFDEGDLETFLQAIIVHGERLADPQFYSEMHNHGIEQDIALMAIALAFPELRASAGWLDLSRTRLLHQVVQTVSREGVHLEHSPGYHIFVLDVLANAVDLAERNGVNLAPPDLSSLLARMVRNVAHFIQPDGRIVPVGDTPAWEPVGPEDPLLKRFVVADDFLRYVLTRGRDGAPGEPAVVFQEAGYAVFRDGWHGAEDFEEAFYLFFTAAAHEGRAHKQADDLSFVIHAGGCDLLVDAGYHSSHNEEPGREYALHSRAHNTVIVDGKGFVGFSSKIDGYTLEPTHCAVQASHRNYAGLVHRRSLLYVRPRTVFVVDEIRSAERAALGVEERGPPAQAAGPRLFEQLFHFAPALEVVFRPASAELVASVRGDPLGRPVVRLLQLAGGRGVPDIVCGQREPLQGWISLAHRTLEPAPVAIFAERGKEATFVTWIEVTDGTEAAEDTGQSATPRLQASAELDRDGRRIVISWPSGGTLRTAVMTRQEDSFKVELGPRAVDE